MTKVERNLKNLKNIVKNLESVVVAYSGGVDSALLAKVCFDVLGQKSVAVTAVSETYPAFELECAKKVAKEIGISHRIIETNELSVKEFSKNPANRCYYCKSELFGKLKDIGKKLNFKNIADGSNFDDTGDFRPGLKAAKELGSQSPLKEAGLTKDDVRALSKLLGLSTWDKPAFACMSSRIPYGEEITVDKLEMVIKAEGFLRGLGFNNIRVRHHNSIARIEAPLDVLNKLVDKSLRIAIIKRLKDIGFNYITVDLAGLRSGSMNEVLTIGWNGIVQDDHKKHEDSTNCKYSQLTVYTDGASRGNPGKAGIGVVIFDSSPSLNNHPKLLEKDYGYIGETTNNVAEYKALIKALEKVVAYNPDNVVFKLDSELLVKQINGEYKVKSKNIVQLYKEACSHLEKISRWRMVHIPRKENCLADELANKGIDSAE